MQDMTITVSMPLRKFQEEMEKAKAAGQTRGQRHLVFMLDKILHGEFEHAAINQNDFPAPEWEKLVSVCRVLEAEVKRRMDGQVRQTQRGEPALW